MSAQFTGKNLIHIERISSTNSYIQELLSKSTPLPNGSVIMADEQTHGRGQMGNFWEAEPHQNLTFSILYMPDFLSIDKQYFLSIAVCLGICDFLEKYAERDFLVKWPNDIYYKEKKIAGILIENSLLGEKIKHSIIGIGININQTNFKSSAPNPVSLKQITQINYSLDTLLPHLLSYIEYYYLIVKAQKFEYLQERFLQKMLYYAEERTYKIAEGNILGRIEGIDAYGRLCLNVDGTTRHFDFKEIEYIID